eukprot:4177315-Karenia_brevis.AAC.1
MMHKWNAVLQDIEFDQPSGNFEWKYKNLHLNEKQVLHVATANRYGLGNGHMGTAQILVDKRYKYMPGDRPQI